MLAQIRHTLNQTKKVPAPLRVGHYQQLVTHPAFSELHRYQQIVKLQQTHQPRHVDEHSGVQRQLADTHALYMAELKAYHVYGRISTGVEAERVMIWHLEDRLTGYGVQNQELYRFLQQEGHRLTPDQFVIIDQDNDPHNVQAPKGPSNQQVETKPQTQTVNIQKDQVVLNGGKEASGTNQKVVEEITNSILEGPRSGSGLKVDDIKPVKGNGSVHDIDPLT
ncbi:hypothetical protein [Amphibacillus cookii]|uniref:hypothetical protein n=1 Tax=Amphibacillus cookii TaxID=767787 RepID=UPI00195D658C|nr:hypothetical protein [Amphibacillus cookii]MBM7543286.1 hypothetical protein [Amphibacillus cookii]